MPLALEGKYQYFTEASMEQLSRVGYKKPFTSLEEATKDYVQSYLAKPNQYL